MKNKILPFLAGMIFGAAIYAGGRAWIAPPEAADQSAVLKAAQKAILDEKARAARLDKREAALKEDELQLANAMGQGPKPGDAAQPDQANKGPGAAIAQMTKTAIKQQMDMRMNALKSRLQLSDDQSKAVQDIMDKEAQKTQDLTEKMLSGKLSQDDLQKAMKDQGGSEDMDAQMQSVLTPDQFTQYQAYQNDEKKSQAEAQANMELMQIQSSLNLSEDQKDKVFTAIYQQYAQQMGVDGAKGASSDINAQMEAKKAALQAVLTPDQMTAYGKFVDSQKEMINSLVGGLNQDNGNSTVQSTVQVQVP